MHKYTSGSETSTSAKRVVPSSFLEAVQYKKVSIAVFESPLIDFLTISLLQYIWKQKLNGFKVN